MDAQGVRYVVPKSGYPKVYRAMEEAKADTDRAVRPYAMTARDGTATTLTIVTVPKKIKPCRAKCGECKKCKPVLMKDKYVAFLTNVRADSPKRLFKHIPKAYRARWGIEMGYRSVESIRAKTKSPKTAARLFLFYFTLVVINTWLYCGADAVLGEPIPEMPLRDYTDCLWLHVTGGGLRDARLVRGNVGLAGEPPRPPYAGRSVGARAFSAPDVIRGRKRPWGVCAYRGESVPCRPVRRRGMRHCTKM